MRNKTCFRIGVFLVSIVFFVSLVEGQYQQSLVPPASDNSSLAALLDHMLDNHYLPSAQVALGSFTYADTQLPTPFARLFEDELRLALGRTSKMKLFDKQVAAAMDPAIREQYAVFFG